MGYRWGVRVAAVLMVLGGQWGGGVAQGGALGAGGVHAVSVTAAGARLTIATPRAAYPPDALVPVTVTLRNVSNRGAFLEMCAGFLPSVQVIDGGGHPMKQPALPVGDVHPACFDPTPPAEFSVGEMLTWRGLMVLRAPGLRAAVEILRTGKMFDGPGTVLQTPVLRFRSLPAARTQAAVVTLPRLHAVVQAPVGAQVYYTDRVHCVDPYRGVSFGGSAGWMEAAGRSIVPTAVDRCTRLTRWRLAIAVEGFAPIWLDHRVPAPPLPASESISAPGCRSVAPQGSGAIAAVWHGAVYVVAAQGEHTCRLTGEIGAKGARLSPDGRWATWLAPERTRHWIDDLWMGRTDGSERPSRVQRASFGTPDHRVFWSPGGKMFAYQRGGSIVVVRPGSGRAVLLAGDGTRQEAPMSWLPDGSALVTADAWRTWAHEIGLALEGVNGQVRRSVVRFPPWLNNPKARPVGSRMLPVALAGADGRHLFLATSGGGARLSGIWEAAIDGGGVRLVVGSRARVQGRPAPAAHLDGATHLFGSPDGRFVAVDPRSGFWVVDTRTLRGRNVPVASGAGCVISQSEWMAGGRAIAFVQTCSLAGGSGFRATLWSVQVGGGAPRRLLEAVDRQPDAVRIGVVYRCVGCRSGG